MTTSSPWPTIHHERASLADDLTGIAPDDWDTPSLCPEWTVHQVLGHLLATATMNPLRFLRGLAAARFRFQEMTDRAVRAATAGGPEQTLTRFRVHIPDDSAPPGPVDSWLGEIIVHSTDIRWSLGLEHDFSADAVVRVADFYKRSNALIGSKTRVSGLALRATDVEWSTGTGPEVTGPILALVMAMTGRQTTLSRLTGDGVARLATRWGTPDNAL